jgi:xanthine dehydrogenase large subunit
MGAKPHATGKSLLHDSAKLHVSGAAAYTDDIAEPRDLLHIAIGMSSKAHAKVTKLDLATVLSANGVADVFVAADIPGENLCGPIVADERIFSDDVVEYAGQAIFAVAAETVDEARKAARLATIEYKELEPILDPLDAIAKKSFVLPSETLHCGDAIAALEAAPHRLQRRLDLGGQDQFYLEGHIAMAVPGEDGTITVYSSTQHPDEVQHLVADVTGRSAKDVVCICRRMGGAFGGKESQAATIACIAALMATKTGRA